MAEAVAQQPHDAEEPRITRGQHGDAAPQRPFGLDTLEQRPEIAG